MFKVFGDIPHCLNQRDDILLGGRDNEEHLQVLQTVLQRAQEHGITFNKDKCEFEKEEIEFFGHVFTKDGLKPSPDKVKALKECGTPKSKEEVRSFLGMAGYLDNFIQGFRHERIIIPEKLQRKIVKIGNSLRHLGKTKTKRMLRNRYWFPYMNNMIDNAVDQCYECQVATKETQSDAIKPSNIPDKSWDTVSVDFGGPSRTDTTT